MGTCNACVDPESTTSDVHNNSKVKKLECEIKTIEPKHVEQVQEIIIDAFTNREEPLGQDSTREFWETYLPVLLGDGRIHEASSVAVLSDDTVIGVCLCQDMATEVPTHIMEGIGALQPTDKSNPMWIFGILEELTSDFKQEKSVNDQLEMRTVLELTISAVHQDYARLGVVSQLKRNMLSVGKEMSYQYVVSEATNKYSQGQNAKLGFEIKREIVYKEWEFGEESGFFPFAKRENVQIHPKLALMVYTY